MNTFFKQPIFSTIAAVLLSLMSVTGAHAAGLMTPSNTAFEQLELREHHVNVVIEDGYAITRIEQVFYNPHNTDLEARYSFPVPAKAAVGELTYWIDGQPVTGEVVKKATARKIYQEQKNTGHDVALSEQDDYKTFDILVFPVRAQQDVKIRLSYIQAAHIDTAIGRYVYPLEDGKVDEEKLSFWTYNDEITEKFSFTLLFRSAYPVDTFYLPQHPNAVTQQLSDKEWKVSLASSSLTSAGDGKPQQEAKPESASSAAMPRLNKDILVYWRHQAGLPGSVDLISYRAPGKERGTFMMTLNPGDDLAAITEGRDWIFVLDYSGSMQGKYHSMINGVKKGLARLNPNDRFRIIIFSTNAQEVTRGFVNADPSNVKHALDALERQRAEGSTNLYEGLQMATEALNSDRSSAIILVTDGVTNTGIKEKKSFLQLMEQHDVRLFTFVMGNGANRPLLEGMVKVSNGFAVNISNSDDISGKILEATSKMTHQAFHNVNITFKGIKVSDVSPQKIGSLYRGQQLIVFGHYWGDEETLRARAHVQVEGKISGQEKRYTTNFEFPDNDALHPHIERLWAYAAIEDLENKMDYFGADADTEQAITDIAVEYGLVTRYTSMLVLRDEEFDKHGIQRSNKKRVDKEKQAQKLRAQQPVRDNRVDQTTPMYDRPAPNYSGGGGGGGGSIGPILMILLLPLLLISGYRRKHNIKLS